MTQCQNGPSGLRSARGQSAPWTSAPGASNRGPRALGYVAALLASTLACGGQEDPGTTLVVGDTLEVDGGTADVTVLPDLGTPTTGVDTNAKPPQTWEGLGSTCGSTDDCPGSAPWCLEGRCTYACIDECPAGWTCKNITSRGRDASYLCVPDTKVLCEPCVSDSGCAAAAGARCIAIAGEGSFCGLPCGTTPDSPLGTVCPGGYTCTEVAGGTSQCLPTTGTCLCGADTAGLDRACSVEFGAGTACTGHQTCMGEAGWGECQTSEPAEESCNGHDDDCDGIVDETDSVGCTVLFPDDDGDGAGSDEASACVCEASESFAVPVGGDCDDGDDKVAPGIEEVCNLVDDDCDGDTDPTGAVGCTEFYADADQDGFGVVSQGACVCQPEPPWTALIGGDCNDAVQTTHPSAPELCNAVDDDCDGETDEKLVGSPCVVKNELGTCPGVQTCEGGEGVCVGKTPTAEVCNGSDDDCDSVADEGTSGAPCVAENTHGSCVGKQVCLGADGLACNAPEPTAESCNGKDDDCDGETDESGSLGCTEYNADNDKDGFGADGVSDCLCKPTAPFLTTTDGDCDDMSKKSYPGAAEVCDTKDNDCDGETDETGSSACEIWLPDADTDGYSPSVVGKCLCGPSGIYTAQAAGDCDDGNNAISPGAIEICDGKDQNCNQIADETCDKDGDGYCDALAVVVGNPPSCPKGVGDCDDSAPAINAAGAESCNGADDNCNGVADEGVTSPCGGCSNLCVVNAGVDQEAPWMTDPAAYDGTAAEGNAPVTLDAQTIQLRSLWVANSGEGTVSRLDTITGREVGRYIVCGDPSRTAVAGDGSVWVGCRGDGRVAHIALDTDQCIDKNGNGTIETSRDADNNNVINGSELMAGGTDECVVLVVQPDGNTIARGLAVDSQNAPWVGFWNSQNIHRLDPVTGAITASANFSDAGGRPYGLALDQLGRVWVALRDSGRLGLVDPTQPGGIVRKFWVLPNGANSYGIAVDQLGQVWQANGEFGTVTVFDPNTEQFQVVSPAAPGNTRGVAAGLDGYLYVAHHAWDKGCHPEFSRHITKIDTISKAVTATWDLGGLHGTVGVSIDFEGHLWAINQCVSSATKIDTVTGTILGEFPTGPSPYTYSDMTGFALKTVVAPIGTYTHLFEGWQFGSTYWKEIDAEATLPDKTRLELRYRTAATQAGLGQALWSQWFGPFPPETLPFPIPSWAPAVGRFIAVQVRLSTDDKQVTPQLLRLTATVGSVQ